MEIGELETGTVIPSVNTIWHLYNSELEVNFQPFVKCTLYNRPLITQVLKNYTNKKFQVLIVSLELTLVMTQFK